MKNLIRAIIIGFIFIGLPLIADILCNLIGKAGI